MSKMGLIEYKEAKKGTNPMITKINLNHDRIKDWTPTISKPGQNTKNEAKFDKEFKDDDENYPKIEI